MTDLASAAIECSRIWAEAWVETNAVDSSRHFAVWSMLLATIIVLAGIWFYAYYLFEIAPARRSWRRQDAEDRRNREAPQ